jgi:hypothetical protein
VFDVNRDGKRVALRCSLDAHPIVSFDFGPHGHLCFSIEDQMQYEKHLLAGNLPFAELKQRALINERTLGARDAPDFSEKNSCRRSGF